MRLGGIIGFFVKRCVEGFKYTFRFGEGRSKAEIKTIFELNFRKEKSDERLGKWSGETLGADKVRMD